MADSDAKDSKTEPATDKKIQDAIDKGNKPFSKEASNFAFLMAMLAILSFLIQGASLRLISGLIGFLEHPDQWRLDSSDDSVVLFQQMGIETALVIAPILAVFVVLGILASLLQNIPSLSFQKIMPDLSRISPGEGWKRVFGASSQIEFAKVAVKFLSVGAVGAILVFHMRSDMQRALVSEPGSIAGLLRSLSLRMIGEVALLTMLVAGMDFVWSRASWRRQLRMSRQEIKDEHKDMAGDPILKSRMRAIARDRIRRKMMAAVPRATVIIANPTHFAVALRYVREEGSAPQVVAKGQDLIALKIRDLAVQHGIPVVEDKMLARSLHAAVEVGQMIPQEFYKAVAGIILFLIRQGKEKK